jgi:hypothetical protein
MAFLAKAIPEKTHFDPLFTTCGNYTRVVCAGSTLFRFLNNDLAAILQQLSFCRINRYLDQVMEVISEVARQMLTVIERSF